MRREFGLAALVALSGCVTIVQVCPDDATVVHAGALGLTIAPHTVSLGLTDAKVVAIPANGCGVAIIENPSPSSRAFWSTVSDRTKAHCLKGTAP